MKAATHQLATFRLGEHLFGVDIERVQEVLRHQRITPVPRADPAVAGLINLRGQVVTAIDMRRRMALPPRAKDMEGVEGMEPMNLVVLADGEVLSLLVDSIGDVIDVDVNDFEPLPDTLSGVGRELLLGAYKLAGGLLLALDVDRVVDIS